MAVINDFSGFGRCSLTVALPIISAMKIQCCAVPTAVFSNHTGYEDFFMQDYTDYMPVYFDKWEKLGLTFDGIYTGYLGSVRQVELVKDFIHRFGTENTRIIVDPVMGDGGKIYSAFGRALCEEIRELLPLADIITPNVTEACILAGQPYRDDIRTETELLSLCDTLRRLGAKDIVITGIAAGSDIGNFVYHKNGSYSLMTHEAARSVPRAGTGDVFASVIASDAVNGAELSASVEKAAAFVADAVQISDDFGVPPQDGICFEEILSRLM